MKVVIQRVSRASCKVDNEIINAINNGYLLLVGFTEGDNIDNVKQMAQKIANLRIFEDENNKLNLNIMDAQAIFYQFPNSLYMETQEKEIDRHLRKLLIQRLLKDSIMNLIKY